MRVVQEHDGGIVEISSNEVGREKARRCVGVLLRGVLRRRCKSIVLDLLNVATDSMIVGDVGPRDNPCSPYQYNKEPPWGSVPSQSLKPAINSAPVASANTPTSATIPAPSYSPTDVPRQPPPKLTSLPSPPSYRSVTQLAAATALPMTPPAHTTNTPPNPPDSAQPRSPSVPTSPSRSRSMVDMVSAQQKSAQAIKHSQDGEPALNRSKSILDLARTSNNSAESVKSSHESPQPASTDTEHVNPFKKEPKQEYAV